MDKVVYIVERFEEMIGENGEWETMIGFDDPEQARLQKEEYMKEDPDGMYRVIADICM